MEAVIPQKNEFDKAIECKKWRDKCKFLVTILSATLAICSLLSIQNEKAENGIVIITILVTILAVYLDYRFKNSFRKAEKIRRDGFLDNTFSTKLADISSKGYYDTDGTEHGMKKLLANLHENSIFTGRIAEKMFLKEEKNFLIWGVGLVFLAVGNFFSSSFTAAIIDMFLAQDILQDYFELKNLCRETETIQDDCKRIASNAADNNWEENNTIRSEILQVCLRYELALSYASLILDSEIYRSLNDSLTKEWEQIRDRYYK